jgi:hypothetical protein
MIDGELAEPVKKYLHDRIYKVFLLGGSGGGNFPTVFTDDYIPIKSALNN